MRGSVRSAVRKFLQVLPYGLFICSFLTMSYFYGMDMSQRLKEHRMHQVQEERKQRIKDICQEEKLTEENIDQYWLNHLIVDDAHRLIYCPIPKVGCTNWKKFMLTLGKGEPYDDPKNITYFVHNDKITTFLGSSPKSEIKAKLTHYTKFLFVRDPFIRLISAYRNKFEEHNDLFYWAYGRNILRTFGNHPDPPERLKDARALGLRVSFHNFIQYLVDPQTLSKPYDVHWRQMFQVCHPCSIEYDFIGHQENMQEEAEHLLRILKLQGDIMVPPAYVNVTSNSLDHVMNWYKTVSVEERRKLYKIFETDFKLFDYSEPKKLLEG